MPRGRLVVLALALLLAVPTATAFRSSRDEVAIAYDANRSPLVLSVGALDVEGAFRIGVLAGLLNESRLSAGTLAVADGSGARTVAQGTVVLHSGSVLLRLDGATLRGTATTDYGFALGLPRSPFDEEGAPVSPALLLAAPALHARLDASGGAVDVIPLDATLSVLDASGAALEGWSRRHVNRDLDAARAEATTEGVVAFRAEGAFRATLEGKALAGGLGASGASMSVDVSRSDADGFLDAIDAMGEVSGLLSGDGAAGGSPLGRDGPLASLEALSGFLNGALVLLPPGGEGNDTAPPEPLDARLGDEAFAPGSFTMLRSRDLALAWGDEEMRVAGTSDVALTRDGFHVDAPLTLGPVPLLSLLLWLAAAGACVLFLVKRPPASKGRWTLRVAGGAVYVVALALAFWWWDASFADTFGTSVLTLLQEKGFSSQSYSQLSLVLGLQMVPWALAGLLFALPVRIGLGVLLRYRGEGSSYKGLAKAGGLVALAILGPIYALWIVNVLLAQVLALAPKLFA